MGIHRFQTLIYVEISDNEEGVLCFCLSIA